ncbi:MAG: histidine phosphatase family protein [Candidatus Sumerlaeia bacterium]|nr:histidine phosphatase family protein [Candidatus Sumerlaeia bacterium]
MLLILMRHGIAEEAPRDETRKLTDEGRRRVRRMARLLAQFQLKPDALLSSRRIRAVQTAHLVAEEMDLRLPVVETPALDFSGTWQEFVDSVDHAAERLAPDAIILACGHQPHLGIMASTLLEGTEDGMDLRKGACLGIRIVGRLAPANGILDFYFTPRLARKFKS